MADDNTIQTPMPNMDERSEFTRFENLTRDLLKVSKIELEKERRGTPSGVVKKTGTT